MATLSIIGTPIGNLSDITLRALEVLKNSDYIIAEDSRVTKKLLSRYNIGTPIIVCHHHSGSASYDRIISLLREGKSLALVTDAGTPGISDPGGKLVEKVFLTLGENVKITPIPGASAVLSALSISGFPADEFTFCGFLPKKKGRTKVINEILESKKTAVFYESPHRIFKTLTFLKEKLDEHREIMVARELTKKFETVYRGNATDVFEKVTKDGARGEYVIVIRS